MSFFKKQTHLPLFFNLIMLSLFLLAPLFVVFTLIKDHQQNTQSTTQATTSSLDKENILEFLNSNSAAENKLYLAINWRTQQDDTSLVEGIQPKNLYLTLPHNSSIIYNDVRQNQIIADISINNSIFDVRVGDAAGPNYDCRECTFEYETISTKPLLAIETIKLWKKPSGIDAINPWVITIDKYYLGSIMIFKKSPHPVITEEEYAMWLDLLRTISTDEKILH